ncbi:MAG: dipeptidase [Cyanobacteria bacterium P01_A01_bin.17]
MVKRRRRIRFLRWRPIFLLALGIALALIIFAIGPSFIAKRFNPTRKATVQPIASASKSLHPSLTIADLHADSLLWGRDLTKSGSYGHVDIPRLIQGNVALQTFTVVTKVPTPLKLEGNSDQSDNILRLAILQRWPISTWLSLKARALYQAKQLEELEQKASEQFRVIQTAADLERYLAQRRDNPKMTAGLLGLEGAQALEGKLGNVDVLYEAGFRVIGLAHFFDNEVSGSVHGLDKNGLTPLGKEVLRRLEDFGMIVDLAHASPQTINDVLQLTERPVLVSHTGVRGTCDNVRNLSDRNLQRIAQTDGIIGIGFWETAVCGENVDAIANAIRYTTDLVGVDHVALGSDFDGAVQMPFDASQMVQITDALRKKGFADIEIQKIMGLNVIRFLQQTLPAS